MISFGDEKGVIRDYDIKNWLIARTQRLLHRKKKIVSLTSKGKYLVSGSSDGYIVVCDYVN